MELHELRDMLDRIGAVHPKEIAVESRTKSGRKSNNVIVRLLDGVVLIEAEKR